MKISYSVNLGRVKGDNGTSYIPSIIVDKDDGKQYIEYRTNDGTPLPDTLPSRIPLNSKFYEPSLDSDGKLVFKLQSNVSDKINLPINLKGDPGRNLINIQIVQNKPTTNNLTEEQKNTIYILKNEDDNSSLNAAIYDDTTNEFIELNISNMISVDNYLTEEDTYTKEQTYNKDEIDTLLNNITNRFKDINDIMMGGNDTNSNGENSE